MTRKSISLLIWNVLAGAAGGGYVVGTFGGALTGGFDLDAVAVAAVVGDVVVAFLAAEGLGQAES
jgi:hypothetical protein